MTRERVCVRTHEEGSVPIKFSSSYTLDSVARRFHHDCSSGFIDVKTTGEGFATLPLGTALPQLRDEDDLEGNGSWDNPFIVRVERAGFEKVIAVVEQMATKFNRFEPQLSLSLALVRSTIWPSPSKVSSGQDPDFRKRLMRLYRNHPDKTSQLMRCMVTGWQVPEDAICAGHLVPVRLAAIAKALGVGVNHPRNGLLWCDFIEAAFEEWSICFSFGLLPNTLKLHIVNKKLAGQKLVDRARCKVQGYVNMLGDKVFRSLDNAVVTITAASGTGSNAFPLRHALAWHAWSAIDMARTKKLLPSGFKVEALDLKVTSEFDEAEAVKMWADMCLTAGPPEGGGPIAEHGSIAEHNNEGLNEEELHEGLELGLDEEELDEGLDEGELDEGLDEGELDEGLDEGELGE